jgi:hypothetical protein
MVQILSPYATLKQSEKRSYCHEEKTSAKYDVMWCTGEVIC